jgi:CheY-specific phosphatase CheX
MEGNRMDSERQRYVEGSLAEAVQEFFGDYDVGDDEEPAEPPPAHDFQMGSLVGFKGTAVRGGLAFVAPATLVAQLLPVPRAAHREQHQLNDWTAEIANQLLGRFKNKLSARKYDFDVGTAVCFRGMSMTVAFPATSEDALSLTTTWRGISVYLDCAFVEGASLPDGPTLRIVPEGDVLLF